MNEVPDKTGDTYAPSNTSVGRLQRWFQELRRRHIFKVTAAYLILAWLLIQVASVLETSLGLPSWTDKLTFAILVIGFPIALFVTWAFDLRPEPTGKLENLTETIHKDVPKRDIAVRKSIQERQNGPATITVLPFENVSSNHDQDYLGDGLTSDIISGLSRIRTFFVIARSSTLKYRGLTQDIRQVSDELGVRYVATGNFAREGNRLRVSVQLADATKGHNVWSENYDRSFNDILAVRDEVTISIIAKLEPELDRAEYERAKLRSPNNLDCWELYHKGSHEQLIMNPTSQIAARTLFEQSIAHDPNFAPAYAGIAFTYWAESFFGESSDELYIKAIEFGRKAVELDDRNARCHYALSHGYMGKKEFDRAIHEAERAIELNPSLADAYHALAICFIHIGRAPEAIPLIQRGMSLSPKDINLGRFHGRLALALLYAKQLEAAIQHAQIAIKIIPIGSGWPVHAYLASALAHADRQVEAKKAVTELIAVQSASSIAYVRMQLPTIHQPYLTYLLDGLRKAGLSEEASDRK